MKLLTYRNGKGLAYGISTPRGVLDVVAAASRARCALPQSPQGQLILGEELIECVRTLEKTAQEDLWRPEWELTLGPCVPTPGKIICIGLNYKDHAKEAKMELPTAPLLFSKFHNALAASGEQIQIPTGAEEIDFEGELVVVIGRRAWQVPQDQALSHVLGYAAANDLASRTLQFRTSQWLLGKTLGGFFPLGPYLVTADEVPDPQALSIKSYVNGQMRQDGHTSDMIFSVRELISYISQYFVLEPGDLISTGTPAGVIMGASKKSWLKAGDAIEIEIQGLGRLCNRMVAAAQ